MDSLTQPLVIVFVVSTMLGVGLSLGVGEIAASLRDRAWVARAVLANFVLLPVLALGIARLLQLDALLGAALLILATAPGGPVLVKLAALAKGDAALAVGLLVTLLPLGVLTQPLVLPLLLGDIEVDARVILLTLICTVLIPLLCGMALRTRRAPVAAMLALPVQRLSTGCMLLVCLALPALHWRELLDISGSAAVPAAALFIVLGAAGGWLCGGSQPALRRMLSLSCAQPNMAAAVVIATQNFREPRVMLMLLLTMLASVSILLPLCLFYGRQAEAARA